MMKVSGLDHDSSDHLSPLPISRKDRTNRPVTHIPTYTHTHTHISCGVVKKRGRTISLRRCLFYFKLSFPFFLFFSCSTVDRKLNNELISGELEIPSRCHHRQIVLSQKERKERKKTNERERERLEAFVRCVCRRERAIRSRQSFGHQHKR